MLILGCLLIWFLVRDSKRRGGAGWTSGPTNSYYRRDRYGRQIGRRP